MELTPLCDIAFKYKTDKCPQIFHTYTPRYYEMFKDRKDSVKKVLEMGIGTMYTMRHVSEYIEGASLKMWREFFPNAHIYGIDIAPEVLIQEDRISTFLVDMYDKKALENLIAKIGSDIDIVIDDGPHNAVSQIGAAKALMPLLKKDVVYIIEDVRKCDYVKSQLPEYDVEIMRLERVQIGSNISRDNNLLIVKHK